MNRSKVLDEIIRDRRSIFPPAFNGDRIDDEIVSQLLENANWAPTHKLTEPWRFHVLTKDGLTNLSEFAGEWYKTNMTGDAFVTKKYEKTKRNPLISSHVIAICMQRDPDNRVPQWEEEAAVACAAQNLWLSVTAYGLGGYWSTPKYSSELGQILDLNDGEYCMGLFYLGIPLPAYEPKSTRTPIDEKVKWYR